MPKGKATSKPQSQTSRPAVLKETIMTPDGQLVQITTKPAPTPKGMPSLPVNAKTRKRHNQSVALLQSSDELVKEQVTGFVSFIREHAVVGLAVGFIIGTQAQAVIKQLVTSFIDPTIQLLLGGAKLSERKLTLHLFHNSAEYTFGAMIYALINLMAVLLTIYILIKVLNLDKLDKPKDS